MPSGRAKPSVAGIIFVYTVVGAVVFFGAASQIKREQAVQPAPVTAPAAKPEDRSSDSVRDNCYFRGRECFDKFGPRTI